MGVWMLDIEAGQTWRFATLPVTFDGDAYLDGLDVSGAFLDEIATSLPSERSASVVIHGQARSELDAEDLSLGAMGVLYYWQDPDGSDDPIALIRGRLVDPVYGASDEPIEATVREVPWMDRGLIPAPEAAINDDTWPNRDPSSGIDDEVYPVVIGEPGRTDVMGSPAYYAQTGATDYVLLAGHPVIAGTVTVYDRTGAVSNSLTVSTVADGLSRNVAVGVATGWGALNQGDELWAVWDDGGGLANPEDPTSALTGAGDLIEWLLHRSTIRVDWGRMRAAKARLNAYRIDTYIQGPPGERVSPWAWISEHLLPILPVMVRSSAAGLYLAVLDVSAPVGVARGRLEEGRNCDRISMVETIGTEDVANDIEIHYAPRSDGDTMASVVRVTGSGAVLDTFDDAVRSSVCEESVRRFGRIPRSLTTTAIYDGSTAVRLATALAARSALPPRQVVYSLRDGSGLESLEPGDTVRLTDSDLGWSGRSAVVWSVRVGTPYELTLRLYRSHGRDSAP